MEGILLINKPAQITSRDVVNKLNHYLGTKKIGHTGTLDPLATGVLVCCVGKYTKLVAELTALDKEYIAEIKLGIKTDTGDITGNIIEEKPSSVNIDDLKNALDSLIGSYDQTVPKYSAIKIKGKKLYEYAREEIDIDLPKRKVNIYSLELLDLKKDIIKIKAHVSKGTYIRSLIEDICKSLNTIGTMSSLVRTKQGAYKLEDCYSFEDIENNNYKLLDVHDIFNYPIIELNQEECKKIINGAKINNTYGIKDKVIFKYLDKYIAIYELKENILKSYIQL